MRPSNMLIKVIFVFFSFSGIKVLQGQFTTCHDDPGYDPQDGPLEELQFMWLGALQYVHVKNGTPHYFRVPRVLLVTNQFVLSTAVDAAKIPDGYALGNVVFGDYERDESECNVTLDDMVKGTECKLAVVLSPVADVLLHPEYKHFGAKNSVALLKMITPIKSTYVLPVCLPFKDFLYDKATGRPSKDSLMHVDFISDVPRDFTEEEKSLSRLRLLPSEICIGYGQPADQNSTKTAKNRVMCSTSCGFRSGAPTLVHEHTGHWTVVAIAEGSSPCSDPLRARRAPPPPRHLPLRRFVPWISTAIATTPLRTVTKNDPFGFLVPRSSSYDTIGHGWMGHWWMGGHRCYDRGVDADDMFRFYHEVFQVKSNTKTFLSYTLEIFAAQDTHVICVKVGLPYRIGNPAVWGLDSPETTVNIPLLSFGFMYRLQIEAWGYNKSFTSSSESEQDNVKSSSSMELY